MALRQQVTALKKERPRPLIEGTDRAFWVTLRSSWPAWASRLVIVTGMALLSALHQFWDLYRTAVGVSSALARPWLVW